MSKTPLEWIKDKADYGRECLVCCGGHKEKHSPLPWKIWHYGTSQDPRAVIQDAKGTLILQTVGKNDDENADTVLHRVNTHDKLVDYCQQLLDGVDEYWALEHEELIRGVFAAIAEEKP